MTRFQLACPAASFVHPVLSLNEADIECGVAGHVRPAQDSPCCEALGPHGYVECELWKMAKRLERAGMGSRADTIKQPKAHTLQDVERDTVRV